MIINSSSNDLSEVLKFWYVSQIVTTVKKLEKVTFKIKMYPLKGHSGLDFSGEIL